MEENLKNKTVKRKRRKTIKCWNCKEDIEKRIEGYVHIPNYICPHCSAEYADKPLVEARLHILQREYLSTRNERTFSEMLRLIEDITYNQIVSKLRKSGVFLDQADIEDKVQWCLIKMVTLYSNVNFKINTSFIDYMGQVVLYPLYNYKQQDKDENEISLFTPIGGKNPSGDKEYTYFEKLKETPILSGNNDTENYFYREVHKDHIINIINEYISKVITISKDKKNFGVSLQMMILFNHYFHKKNDKFFAGWWETEGLELRDFFEKSVTLLRDTIRDAAET